MRRLLALSLLLALPALAQGRRVAVVPFASLSGDTPPGAGTKAAGMLASGLRSAGGVEVVEGTPGEDPGTGAAALPRAREAVGRAAKAWAARQLRPAEEALVQALADYGAGAAGVEDVGEVADAWALLAAVQYATGRDGPAQVSLARALALAPARPLPLAGTSPLFSREVERVRQEVRAGPRGQLLVESTPAGAEVVLDGVRYGPSPVRVRDVPPGHHLWRVRLPAGEWVGGAVEVAAGKEARVQAETGGSSPEGRLTARLARNRLDAELLAAARDHATALGVQGLVFGALRREGPRLTLEAFLFQPTSGELRRLPPTAFDVELLSAGQQLLALAGPLAQGAPLGEGVRVPAPVTAAALPTPAPAERTFVLGEAAGGAQPAARPPPREEDGRKPLKRAPLRRP